MREVHPPVTRIGSFGQEDEAPPFRLKPVEDRFDDRALQAGHRLKLAQRRRSPHPAVAGIGVGDALEDPGGGLDVDLLEGLFRVDRQGSFEGARRAVVLEVDRAVATVGVPCLPGPVEGMLEDGQPIGAVAQLVEEQVEQSGGEPGSGEPCRASDRLPELLASQPRHEIAAAVHRLRQAVE